MSYLSDALVADAVRKVGAIVKPLGYRKRGNSFNRRLADVVHVVSVARGRAWSSSEGSVSLDAGVFVPGFLWDASWDGSKWVSGGHIQLRERTRFSQEDVEMPPLMARELELSVLPWLDRYPDEDSMLEAFHRIGRNGLSVRHVDIAFAHWRRGEKDTATRVLRDWLSTEPALRSVKHLRDKYAACGLTELAEVLPIIERLPGEPADSTR